jgi:enoyl-CoA hydratase/carnithine racemase
MSIAALTIDARRLWAGEGLWEGPLAFVDLAASRDAPQDMVLPPCPVIGLGDPAHPFARHLDAVIEAPIAAEGLMRQVQFAPQAAAVTAQLLRLLPSLPLDAALTAESLAYGMLQGSAEHRQWLAGRGASPGRTEGRVQLDRLSGHLTISLDHPASGNAIDRAMRDQLYQAFALAALDPDLHRVSLRGLGRSFSLGAELSEFGTTSDPARAHAIRHQTLPARMLARVADRLDVHVQGGCVGAGLELAAWARRITAAPGAWFQLPELAMGILPGAGGCVALTRRIGRQRAALLMLSGKRISAKVALGWGLIEAIASDDRGADIA